MGFEVLLKGSNMIRLLMGLLVSLKISFISVLISILLGVTIGILITLKNPVLNVIFRIYLEIVRIMPQMVLLFILYFGSTRVFGLSITAEVSAVMVFVFWGTAEMGDLVRGSIKKYTQDSV